MFSAETLPAFCRCAAAEVQTYWNVTERKARTQLASAQLCASPFEALLMKMVPSGDILHSIFRANPEYELVCFDRLPAEQRAVLKDLQQDPNFYGVLRPLAKSGLGVKSVSRDTALLYLTLQQPGHLPDYVRTTLGDKCSQDVTRLVLDGVLSVERNGKFLSGSEASAALFGGNGELTDTPVGPGFLERLSVDALLYGQSLGLTDSVALSTRLYGYNRTPLSPYWKRILPDPHSVTEYLHIREGRNRELLDREWLRAPVAAEGWLAWQARRFGTVGSFGDRTKIRCKLYVSPKIDHLPEVLPPILAVLSRTRVRHFKIGKDASGLLRPDKMVAYFSSYEDLVSTTEQLKKELAGCPAHGVPFTAELAGNGLLSVGVDPPREEPVLPWMGHESWRLWVTNRLAVALIAASMAEAVSLEPWQFALRRLQLEGVDTHSWTPVGTDWKRSFDAEA